MTQAERKRPICWSIAGTDPGGGAGIQADLKTFHGLDAVGITAITAVVAQNTHGVRAASCVSEHLLDAQLDAMREDFPPGAIKTGMLGQAALVRSVVRAVRQTPASVVCDPVCTSTSGTDLLDEPGRQALLNELLPLVSVITPNRPEAARLTGISIETPEDVARAAKDFLERGARSVLIKGGHARGDWTQDYWTDGTTRAWIGNRRVDTPHTHGAGCTLSAAIAAGLAHGYAMLDAIVLARAYVQQGLRHAGGIGTGRGPLAHLGWPTDPADLPLLTADPLDIPPARPFPKADAIGLYPIVERADDVERLLRMGVRTIQLRCKGRNDVEMDDDVRRAVASGHQYQAHVYINDHWRLALKHGAYGVHLGQDDLDHADLEALRTAGLRLGISTHGYAELARAVANQPSYVAIGTLFHSPSKSFAHAPLGLERFARLRRLVDGPVVAIGGITVERAREVRAAGADGMAVISDVLSARDPAERIARWNDFFTNAQ